MANLHTLTCFVSLEQPNRKTDNAVSVQWLESCIWAGNWIKSCYKMEYFITGGESPSPEWGVSLPWPGTVFILSGGSPVQCFSSTECSAGPVCTTLTGSRVLLLSFRTGNRNMRWCQLAKATEEGGGNRIVPWDFPGTQIFASSSAVEPKVS